MNDPPQLQLMEARFYERPVVFRLPFRFGAVTVTQAPQAFVRVRIRSSDGQEEEGVAADLLAPKWFDKSPALTHEENFAQLRRSLGIARRHLLGAGMNSAFGLSAAVDEAHHAACATGGLNGLIASFGLALHERAIIDALGRLQSTDVFTLVRSNRLGLTAARVSELDGFDLDAFLPRLQPAPAISARHTVGLVDALTSADLVPGQRLDDGLPETLEEAIAAYGHRYFKLKVSGRIEADVERLARIADVLDRTAADYQATLDGNEQYEHVEAVVELWRRINEDPRLAGLKARAHTLAEPVHALAAEVPMEIDESDADMDAFPRARALGYRGISSKSCKGFYRALLNRARVAKWNAEEGGGRYFMSAEDLTTQAGVAVQQDLALATLVGATHVERNGHHYVDGMVEASAAEQDAFLAAHPQLYRKSNGRLRIAIDRGQMDVASLARVPGLAVGPMPDFGAMQPMASE
jgi:hypothetical protein